MSTTSPPTLPFLPYGHQSINEDDVAAVAAALRSDWLTQGPAVERFETMLAERVEARHAIACSTGTAALHLAMLALGIGPGDAVVVPAITFLATANAARYTGAEVAFADVDPATGLLTVEAAAAAAEDATRRGWRVRALVPVHYAGQCAPMTALAALAARHGWAMVEDACHAIGTTMIDSTIIGGGAVPVGAARHGGLAAFSFHPVKTIAAGEGGAVTTNDDELDQRLRRYRNHGMERDPTRLTEFSPTPWAYEMTEPGFNHRLSDLHAALAASQLRRLDAFVARRAALMARYAERLTPLSPHVQPLGRVAGCAPGWHLCAVRIAFADLERDRATVMADLRDHGIGTQVHYIPVHRQPYYRQRYGNRLLPGAELFYERILSLPLFPAMGDGDVDRVVDTLASALCL